jgi:hypothetical protein
MDDPAPKSKRHFKLSYDQTEKVQDFLRGYCQGLQLGDRPTIDTLLSTVQKQFPELLKYI